MPVQSETVVRELKKWGMSLPSLGKLIVALMADPRVPRMNKIVVGGITAYLVTRLIVSTWVHYARPKAVPL